MTPPKRLVYGSDEQDLSGMDPGQSHTFTR